MIVSVADIQNVPGGGGGVLKIIKIKNKYLTIYFFGIFEISNTSLYNIT